MKPSYVIITLIVAVLLLGGTVSFGNISLGDLSVFNSAEEQKKSDREVALKKETIIWKARFVDIHDETGEPKLYDEELIVSKSDDGKTMSAKVKSTQDGRPKKWQYHGFVAGEYLTFSYKNFINETGIGNILLEAHKDSYVGHWTGRTCNSKYIVRCPYVLSINDTADLTVFDKKMKKVGCSKLEVKELLINKYDKPVSC